MNGSPEPATPSPSSTPWSVEHYGFADSAPPVVREPVPASPRQRPNRLRLVLAAGALALGLTAGGVGFAAAQATAGSGDTQRAAVISQQFGGDHGHLGGGR